MAFETWGDTKAAWRSSFDALVERFRPLYLAEVVRCAETLRPRFESGELHGYRPDDDGDVSSESLAPMDRLEDLCAEHFGIRVDEVERVEDGRSYLYDVERDPRTADMILEVSPSAEGGSVTGQDVPSFNAKYSIAWDVLAVARARGWYRPPHDECPSPESLRPATEALS
jgi:hypothetical protein